MVGPAASTPSKARRLVTAALNLDETLADVDRALSDFDAVLVEFRSLLVDQFRRQLARLRSLTSSDADDATAQQ